MARRSYPLSSDEVLIPFSPHARCFFPDKTNKLSIINKQNIINATWKIARKKQNCIIKESFSPKFEKLAEMKSSDLSGMAERLSV